MRTTMKLNRHRYGWRLVIMALMMAMILQACTGVVTRDVDAVFPDKAESVADIFADTGYEKNSGESGSWAIYWYLCGSDLESGGGRPGYGGAATLDLQELLNVTLPENVTVVIETGGARKWQNDVVSADALERYVYQGDTLRRMESVPQASMGDPNTLADFLTYCNKNYPAEKQALLLWDHGGGSLMGMEMDELHRNDLLSLPEFRSVLDSRPASSGMYELVGFDACLMATIDMVDVLNGHARYMVASEEVEPGIGWDYTGLFNAMVANPQIDGAELGTAICDTYYSACVSYRGLADTITLSVVDLTKAQPLLEAYNATGQEALLAGCEQREAYFSAFGRAASDSQNYGGGDGKASPYDMTDLGDLIENAAVLLPETGQRLLAAIEDCVVYQVMGQYRAHASGLACYYNYSADISALRVFSELNTSEAFSHFYHYALTGELSEAGKAYVTSLTEAPEEPDPDPAQPSTAPPSITQPNTAQLTSASTLNLEGFPLTDGKEKVFWGFDPGYITMDYISSLFIARAYLLEDNSRLVCLGYDTNFSGSLLTGHFQDAFSGEWYAIDGQLIYVFSGGSYPSADNTSLYEIFETPVLLNGEPYRIVLAKTTDMTFVDGEYGYSLSNHQFEILHARRDNSEDSGNDVQQLASKETRLLVPGDVIEPIFPTFEVMDVPNNTVEAMVYGKITVTENTSFGMEDLGDGTYRMNFYMFDYAGNSYNTETKFYIMKDKKLQAASWVEN